MNVLEDFNFYLIRGLGLLAQWLTNIFDPVPWPIVMAILAIPLLFIINLVVWFVRGTIWPVRCKHPQTVKPDGSACENWVRGEWRYCHHHRAKKQNSKGATVNPKLSRWETVNKEGFIVFRTDIKGTNNNTQVLFHKGFARRPRKLFGATLDIIKSLIANIKIIKKVLMKEELEDKQEPAVAVGIINNNPSNNNNLNNNDSKRWSVNPKAARADKALKILLFLIPTALIAIAATVFIDSSWIMALEYLALLLLWVVFEIVKCGLLQPVDDKLDWRWKAIFGTLKGVGLVLALALVFLLLDSFALPFLEGLAES